MEVSMRNLLLFLFVVLTLTACGGGGGGGDVPTLVPTVGGSQDVGQGDGDGPRITPDSGLPPTWTPAPTAIPATLPPATIGPGTPPPAGDGDTYTVQAGDTLAEIAARFNVTVADLAEANDIANIDVIEVGQVLVIP
jgi:LysM repeat protein